MVYLRYIHYMNVQIFTKSSSLEHLDQFAFPLKSFSYRVCTLTDNLFFYGIENKNNDFIPLKKARGDFALQDTGGRLIVMADWSNQT